MLNIFACMLLGIGCGWLLRKHRIKYINKVIMLLICLLLLVLGVEVGQSNSGIANVHLLVGAALLIAVLAMAVSILFAWMLDKKRSR
ncbi:MAG: LysO family transporter [Porphyromonas sp.]|nr:LysO family transporter [Porphyromonas sp.]